MTDNIKIPKNLCRVRDEFSDFQSFLDFAEKQPFPGFNIYELWQKNSFLTVYKKDEEKSYAVAWFNLFLNVKLITSLNWLLSYDLLEAQIIKLLKTDKTQTVIGLVKKRDRVLVLLKRSKKKIIKNLEILKNLITLYSNSQPKECSAHFALAFRFKTSYSTNLQQIESLKQWLHKI